MFVPPHFAETDRDTLHAFVRAHGFGLLVSDRDGAPVATHLPLRLDPAAGPHGALVGHLARANPQWRGLDGRPVLGVFSGPHAYVSPAWYEAADVVPTWNYTAVHAAGVFRVVDDPAAVAEILADTVGEYEGSRPAPWTLDTGTDYFGKMVRGIVAFRVEIVRLDGVFKLSQNHSPERRAKVIRALEQSADPGDRATARLMAERLAGGPP